MRKIFAILMLGLCLSACRRTEPDAPREGLPASLSISISIPQIETKAPGYADGHVSPADAAGSGWSDWDRLVDGQSIYRLTLFLVRLSDNKLVGFRDFYKNSNDYCNDAATYGLNGFCTANGTLLDKTAEFATCARAYFSYLNPMYGAHEKLSSGNYRLYAIANYTPISGVTAESGTKNYAGLPDDGNGSSLENLVAGIKATYTSAGSTGIADFKPENATYAPFFNYKVMAAKESDVEQYVCEQRPQPLTFMTDFLVLSGTNRIEAELVRTYSRIRIELNNESETETLTLNSFSYLTPFAQKQAYIFDHGDDNYSDAWIGTPVLTSPHCIHPYPGDGNLTINPTATPAPEYSKVVFDAYVLESKRGSDKYQYRLDVEFPSVSSSTIRIYDGNPIRSTSSLQTALNNSCTKFLIIENGRGHGFLFENGENIVNYEANNSDRRYLNSRIIVNNELKLTPVAPETFETIDLNDASLRKFVWDIQKINEALTDWDLWISNYDSGRYWDKNIVNNNTNERLKTTVSGYKQYRAEEWSGGPGIAFRNLGYTANTDPCYLHKDRYGTKTKNKDSVFALYALDNGLPAQAVKDVTLQVIDPVSNQPIDLEEFRRNDFITVNVAVSVHPDGGWLEFKVIPWVPKTGTVIFN